MSVICWAIGPTETGWGGTNDYWDYLYDYTTESSAHSWRTCGHTNGPVTNFVNEC